MSSSKNMRSLLDDIKDVQENQLDEFSFLGIDVGRPSDADEPIWMVVNPSGFRETNEPLTYDEAQEILAQYQTDPRGALYKVRRIPAEPAIDPANRPSGPIREPEMAFGTVENKKRRHHGRRLIEAKGGIPAYRADGYNQHGITSDTPKDESPIHSIGNRKARRRVQKTARPLVKEMKHLQRQNSAQGRESRLDEKFLWWGKSKKKVEKDTLFIANMFKEELADFVKNMGEEAFEKELRPFIEEIQRKGVENAVRKYQKSDLFSRLASWWEYSRLKKHMRERDYGQRGDASDLGMFASFWTSFQGLMFIFFGIIFALSATGSAMVGVLFMVAGLISMILGKSMNDYNWDVDWFEETLRSQEIEEEAWSTAFEEATKKLEAAASDPATPEEQKEALVRMGIPLKESSSVSSKRAVDEIKSKLGSEIRKMSKKEVDEKLKPIGDLIEQKGIVAAARELAKDPWYKDLWDRISYSNIEGRERSREKGGRGWVRDTGPVSFALIFLGMFYWAKAVFGISIKIVGVLLAGGGIPLALAGVILLLIVFYVGQKFYRWSFDMFPGEIADDIKKMEIEDRAWEKATAAAKEELSKVPEEQKEALVRMGFLLSESNTIRSSKTRKMPKTAFEVRKEVKESAKFLKEEIRIADVMTTFAEKAKDPKAKKTFESLSKTIENLPEQSARGVVRSMLTVIKGYLKKPTFSKVEALVSEVNSRRGKS